MLKDRKEAGILLAGKLEAFVGRENVVVLALPRGGVVTGAEVARRIRAPLDILIVRKIGHPWQAELALGAISETGAIVYNEDILLSEGVTTEYLYNETVRQREEIERRRTLYRGSRPLIGLTAKIVLLVDDGIATGASLKTAIETLHQEKPERVIAAVPVAPRPTATEIAAIADAFVCLETPENFLSVSSYYTDFDQVTDNEVIEILGEFWPPTIAAA